MHADSKVTLMFNTTLGRKVDWCLQIGVCLPPGSRTFFPFGMPGFKAPCCSSPISVEVSQ